MDITNKEKKDFIDWFIKNHKTKSRSSQSLLTLIAGNDKVVENIVFVNENKNYPKYLVISTDEVDGHKMLYIENGNGNVVFEFAEILMKIRINLKDKLYINLNFKDKEKSPEYSLVAEIEPANSLNTEVPLIAEELIKETEKELRKYYLLKEIDKALDDKNRKLFITLTNELKQNLNNKT
jgi:uncharacterized protein YpiB (UPF0302 family)